MASSKYVIIAAVVAVSAFFIWNALSNKKRPAGFQKLTADEAFKLVKQFKDDPNFVILDIRTKNEFKSGHIPGAINIDFNAGQSFEQSLSALDRNKKYLVYCRSGNRSGRSMSTFAKLGFTDIIDMSGGIGSWRGDLVR